MGFKEVGMLSGDYLIINAKDTGGIRIEQFQ